MVGACVGIGASLTALDLFVDWLRGRGRFAERQGQSPAEPALPDDPALAELLRMLDWPDEKLAHAAMDFAIGCSPYQRDPRLVAGCERLARIGLARQGADADHIVEAALRGLHWMGASQRIRAFESAVLQRDDLPAANAWLRDPRVLRSRRERETR
jgi:hypothetical protein